MDSSNTKSGKQEKLGEVKKSSFLEGRGGGDGGGWGGGCAIRKRSENFHFQGGLPYYGGV